MLYPCLSLCLPRPRSKELCNQAIIILLVKSKISNQRRAYWDLSPKYEVVGKVGMWHPFPNLGKCLLHPIRKNRTLKFGFNFESKSQVHEGLFLNPKFLGPGPTLFGPSLHPCQERTSSNCRIKASRSNLTSIQNLQPILYLNSILLMSLIHLLVSTM